MAYGFVWKLGTYPKFQWSIPILPHQVGILDHFGAKSSEIPHSQTPRDSAAPQEPQLHLKVMGTCCLW